MWSSIRINFWKILLLVYEALSDLGPKYIYDLRYEPSGTSLLTVPRVVTEKQHSVFMHLEQTLRKLVVCLNSQVLNFGLFIQILPCTVAAV